MDCGINYSSAVRMYHNYHPLIKKTPSGNFLYNRGHYKGDIHLIQKPFAHKSLPFARKEIIYEKAGLKYVA